MHNLLKTNYFIRVFIAALAIMIAGGLINPVNQAEAQTTLDFTVSGLSGENLKNPTSLQFGPDGRLYVSQQNGAIFAYTISRNAANTYVVDDFENIQVVKNFTPNHDDTGVFDDTKQRQVTGIYATGTALNPVLYVGSSDWQIGAGAGSKGDVDLDTNSSIIHKLTCVRTNLNDECDWDKIDLVRGLPRSEENHSINGLALDEANQILYVTIGGMTNAGAPSNNFTKITEYVYATAILSVDLADLESRPVQVDNTLYGNHTYQWVYDLPTLDDPTQPNVSTVDGYTDPNDPFGGNDGLNQAKIDPNGPVQIYSPGYRNIYDIVITQDDRMYGVDNGANKGWGGHPIGEKDYAREYAGIPSTGECTNEYDPNEPGGDDGSIGPGGDPGVNNLNGLHYIRPLQPGEFNYVAPNEPYYAGHPHPVRGNPTGAGLYTVGPHTVNPDDGSDAYWRNQILPESDPNFATQSLPVDWPPIPPSMAYAAECDFRNSGEMDGALANYGPSTNGITEYTATNLNGKFQGDILAAGYGGKIYRAILSEDGTEVTNCPNAQAVYTNNLNTLNNGGTAADIETLTTCEDQTFAENFGSIPLDVIAQGNNDIFPGTVWAATYGSDNITVFEPTDYDGGTGQECIDTPNDDTIDGDSDGYTNFDETQNGTNVCSATSIPTDNDGTMEFGPGNIFLRSDLLDPDDDNDGLDDTIDPFAYGCGNGLPDATCDQDLVYVANLPVLYNFFNNDPGFGVAGLGFTGIMSNGTDDYYDLLTDPERDDIIFGGTAGILTIPNVTAGDITGNTNNQNDGFQFAINVDQNTAPFTIVSQLNSPYFDGAPSADESLGIQIGTGDMDNYLQIALHANNGNGGIQVVYEENGTIQTNQIYPIPAGWLNPTDNHRVYLNINPATGEVQPQASINGSPITNAGPPITVTGNVLAALQGNYTINTKPSALAVGITSTNAGADPFAATWDYIYIEENPSEATALVEVDTGGLDSSTYGDGFRLENTANGINIDTVTFNIESAILPEILFDPNGTAGDAVARGFFPVNNSETTTGVTNVTYGGPYPFPGDPSNGGFYTLTLDFNSFEPGDVLEFGIDIDPNSTRGYPQPGPSDAGSVSGLELIGGEVTVNFANGDNHTVELYRKGTTVGGSANIVRNQLPSTPSVQVLGSNTPVAVGNADQVVRISGPVNSTVRLLQIEAGMFEAYDDGTTVITEGYAVDPFEYNSVISVQEFEGTTGNNGVADFDVTLTNSGPETGYNVFAAVVLADDGATSDVSDFVVIQYDPALQPDSVLRINAGGPQFTDAAGDVWVADDETPTPDYSIGGNCFPSNCLPGNTDITGTVDDPLYQTERSGKNFSYVATVANGTYSVDLHFAEIFFGLNGRQGEGARIFDVIIEGQTVLDNYDILANTTPATAIVETISNVSVNDNVLNITFTSEQGGTNNAKISAIDVYNFSPSGGGETPIILADIANQYNLAGTQPVLSVVAAGGDGNLAYSQTGLPTGLDVEPTNGQITGTIDANAANGGTNNDGVYNVTITVDDGDGNTDDQQTTTFDWVVRESSEYATALYRVNLGGETLTAADNSTPAWSEDTQANPSPYLTDFSVPFGTGSGFFPTSDTISLNDPTVNGGAAPMALFQKERYGNMNWEFAVQQGLRVEVRLYLAEIFLTAANNNTNGPRVFDAAIEGTVVPEFNDVDQFGTRGHDIASMRAATAIVNDGILNLDITSISQNAAIKGIEIVALEGAPTIISPTEGQTVFNSNVTIDLQTGTPSTGTPAYNVEVATDNTFTNIVFDSGNVNTTSIAATLPDGTYYTRARQGNVGAGTSLWSDTVSFTVNDVGENLITNGDFSNGTTAFQFTGNVTQNVVNETLEMTRSSTGGLGVVSQNVDGINITAGTKLETRVRLGNNSPSAKRVELRLLSRNGSGDVIGSVQCEFHVVANPNLADYGLLVQTPVRLNNVEVQLRLRDLNEPSLRVDDLVLIENPALDVNQAECDTPALIGNGNIAVNSQFNNNTAAYGFPGDVTRNVNGNVLNVTRAASATSGAVIQNVPLSAPANATFETKMKLGNSSARMKYATVRLWNPNNASDAMVCAFPLPANTPLKTHTLRGKTANAWDSIRMELTLEDFGTPSILVDDINVQYKPALDVVGTQCRQPIPPANTPLNVNGDFENPNQFYNFTAGLAYTWDSGIISATRANTSTQQGFSQMLRYNNAPANVPLEMTVELGNTDAAPKPVTLRVWDGASATNAIMCEFVVSPNTALQTFTLQGLTNARWANVMVQVAVEDANAPSLLVDNLALAYKPGAGITGTSCNAPLTTDENLIINGDFALGDSYFTYSGSIDYGVTGGVLEVTRTDTEGEAVVSQNVSVSVPASAPLVSTINMSNPTSIDKVAVLRLASAANPTSEMICYFDVPANTPMQMYGLGGETDIEWNGISYELTILSVGDPGVMVDDITLYYRDDLSIPEVRCEDSTGTIPAAVTAAGTTETVVAAAVDIVEPTDTTVGETTQTPLALPISASMDNHTHGWLAEGSWTLTERAADGETGMGWQISGTETAALTGTRTIDLRNTTQPELTFRYQLATVSAAAAIQARVENGEWNTLATIAPSGSWETARVDLGNLAGEVMEVRFVWIGGTDANEGWRVDNVTIAEREPAATEAPAPTEPVVEMEQPVVEETVVEEIETIEVEAQAVEIPEITIEMGEMTTDSTE